MRLADGLAVIVVGAVTEAVAPTGPGVMELATPPLLEHPANSTTAIAPTLAATHVLRCTSLMTDPTPCLVCWLAPPLVGGRVTSIRCGSPCGWTRLARRPARSPRGAQ